MSDSVRKHVKVHEFLRQHPMGVLSTVSSEGQPWGAAIYYVADDEFNFYFVTKAGTIKYHNLAGNPAAALTVADSDTQTTVQASGRVSKLPTEEYMNVVYGDLAKVSPLAPPIEKLDRGDYMPLKLTPSRLHYADYQRSRNDPHADYVERIIDGA